MAFEQPRGFSAPRWNIFAGSQSAEKSRRSNMSWFFIFSQTNHWVFDSYAIPGEKLSYCFSVESFKILAPSKVCFTYVPPVQNRVKSNCKTYTRIEVNFNKRGSVTIYLETPTRHTANWGLRSPPSTRVKTWAQFKKVTWPNRQFFLFLTQILTEAVPPLFTHTP